MPIQTTPPTEEPVSLEEARVHLRLTPDDTDVEDGLIAIWIAAARRHAEMLTGRSFITQGWRLVLDAFPHCIELERGDVQEIDSITYRDMAGQAQTVAWAAAAAGIQRSTDATLVADLTSARITPAFGCTWPIALPEIGAIAVNYAAGYGDAADVPENIKSWILLRVGLLYTNREALVDGNVKPLPHVDGLLDPSTIILA